MAKRVRSNGGSRAWGGFHEGRSRASEGCTAGGRRCRFVDRGGAVVVFDGSIGRVGATGAESDRQRLRADDNLRDTANTSAVQLCGPALLYAAEHARGI